MNWELVRTSCWLVIQAVESPKEKLIWVPWEEPPFILVIKGVEEIETVGKTFDPELHEAVSSIQDENLGTQEVAQEYRKGYKIGNRVIRHSMVVVAN